MDLETYLWGRVKLSQTVCLKSIFCSHMYTFSQNCAEMPDSSTEMHSEQKNVKYLKPRWISQFMHQLVFSPFKCLVISSIQTQVWKGAKNNWIHSYVSLFGSIWAILNETTHVWHELCECHGHVCSIPLVSQEICWQFFANLEKVKLNRKSISMPFGQAESSVPKWKVFAIF